MGDIMEYKKENIKMQNIENEVNNIFSILTKENDLTLEELDKLFSKNVELKNKYLIQMKSRADILIFLNQKIKLEIIVFWLFFWC